MKSKVIIYFFLSLNVVFSQTSIINLFSPNLPHISNIHRDSGFLINYNLPGFYSPIGQINFYYSTMQKDAFYFGIGMPYLMCGINKRMMFLENSSSFYFNGNFGITDINGGKIIGIMGSVGISYLTKTENNKNLEIAFDIFVNTGRGSCSMFICMVPNIKGVSLIANYSLFNNNSFRTIFTGGMSISQIHNSSKNSPVYLLFQIPIGINFTYNF